MAYYLGVDPGICTGWALVDTIDGSLVRCGLDSPPLWGIVLRAAIERPQIYPGTRPKQANDLITLAIQVGRLEESISRYCPDVRLVLPHTWKGNVPKDIANKRILEALSPAERLRIPKLPASKLHNVIDAIGLAKYLWNATRQNP